MRIDIKQPVASLHSRILGRIRIPPILASIRQQQLNHQIAFRPLTVFEDVKIKRRQLFISLFSLALAAVVWIVSLQRVPVREMNDTGLLSVLPPTYYVALGILVISFVTTLFYLPEQKILLFSQVTLLILILHGTPIILYGTPRYAWAWKHVGIVDYILRHQRVDPNIPLLSQYHNWAGFFALGAFLVQAVGFQDAFVFALWAPIFFSLAFFGGLFLIYRGLIADRRWIWLSIWFFFLANWVGQDYFAPQAFGYFLYLVMVGILLLWFRPAIHRLGDTSQQGRWGRLAAFIHNLYRKALRTEVIHPASPAQNLLLVAMVILFMFVITASHQLTPLMALSALAFLTLFRGIYPRSLVWLMAVLESIWLFFIAFVFVGDTLHTIFSSFGAVERNISGSFINLSRASTGQILVAYMGRGLTLLVLLLAAIGFLWRFRRQKFDLIPLLLVLTPLPILAANSYGGEILFRVYFFALPFLAYFIGGLFFSNPEIKTTWLSPLLATSLSIIMLVCFLFPYYGKEKQYYSSPEEAASVQFLLESAPPGSLIVEGTRNFPTFFRNYEDYTYVTISDEAIPVRQEVIHDPVQVLSRWMGNEYYPAAYLIVTKSQKADVEMVGDLPAGSLDQIEAELIRSGKFVAIFRNQDAAIYTLRARGER